MPPRSRTLSVVDSHLILPGVHESVAELKLGPADEGMRRLAEQYASAIDDAQAIAREAVRLAESAEGDREKALSALLKRLDAGSVLGELGPKLLAALESLGASPKARAAMTGKGAKPDASTGKSSLAQRRARAAERQSGAGR